MSNLDSKIALQVYKQKLADANEVAVLQQTQAVQYMQEVNKLREAYNELEKRYDELRSEYESKMNELDQIEHVEAEIVEEG